MHQLKKTLAGILAALMVMAAVAGVITAAVMPASAAEVVVKAYDSTQPGRAARAITSDYGIRFKANGSITAISVSMPTWSKNDSEATLAIYKWDTTYDKTIAAAPITETRFAPLRDNAYNALTFDEQPAGEYFVRIYDITGSVGVWQMDKKVSAGFCYEDGKELEADWEMNVTFTAAPETPFLPVKSAAEAISGDHTPPAEYEIPADSLLNTHKVMPDTWVFTDGLGRVSLTNAEVGDPKADKTLAMFYWTWHADLSPRGAVNTTELMKQYPDAKNDYNHAAWKNTGHYCFWNEPIYGFYRTDDAWVLRRQAELLANAGVDVIFADNTNGSNTWRQSYLALYEAWDDAQKNGAVDVPKVSYLLPFGPTEGSDEQVRSIYQDIYRPGKYQNLWFYWDDKPMLMGYNNNFASRQTNLDKEIYTYFTWRAGQANYRVNSTAAKQWGWLSVYPQAQYSVRGQNGVLRGMVEQMTVGVAVNHNYVTKEITAMNGQNVMGRSYTSDYPNRYEVEGPSASLWGYQFAEQFTYALEVDPEVIFVTGWNEWHAWRQSSPWGGSNSLVNNALVDQFDNEFSRDLEPTKGELKDHYYYQFVNFARRYKGASAIPTPSVNATIDLSAGAEQWTAVEPYYAAYIGNTDDRDAKGYGNLTYTETSGRNDIIGAQVARDDEYVYFHVECAENITAYTDKLWMNLYIDAAGDGALDGWNSFDYIVNKTAASEKTLVLEKFTGNGYASERVADVEYTVDGRYMTVKIAKADLGLSGDDYTINFSWTDNVHDEGDYETYSGDILDFYISGDVAPGGRFKYSYISTRENSGKAPLETEAEAEPVTETDTVADTTAEDTAATTEGCQSVVALNTASVLALLGTAILLRKRES